MRIAMVGTRGVPARYGGFETAVEEVGTRLVAAGHQVTVYCRGDDRSAEYLGMKRVRLPALQHPAAETLSHTALSVAHLIAARADVAFVFNAANAPLVPALRAARIPVALHVDGLEWKRAKWGPLGRRYYLANERLAARAANALIADAQGIQDYYHQKYRRHSELLTYGAPIIAPDLSRLTRLGLSPGEYHLVVARLEPENHVDVILEGYLASKAKLPLIIVGSVPYPSAHEAKIHELARSSPNVTLLGGVWDQDLLNALYAGAASYLHGHHVGGTNPSLLRAMGAAAPVIAFDVNFNREVVGDDAVFFSDSSGVAKAIEASEDDPASAIERGLNSRERAALRYRWWEVALGYERLADSLRRDRSAAGSSTRAASRADHLRSELRNLGVTVRPQAGLPANATIVQGSSAARVLWLDIEPGSAAARSMARLAPSIARRAGAAHESMLVTVRSEYERRLLQDYDALYLPDALDGGGDAQHPTGSAHRTLVLVAPDLRTVDLKLSRELLENPAFGDAYVYGHHKTVRHLERRAGRELRHVSSQRELEAITSTPGATLAAPIKVNDRTLRSAPSLAYTLTRYAPPLIFPRMLWPAELDPSSSFLVERGIDLRTALGEWLRSTAPDARPAGQDTWHHRATQIAERL